MITDHKLLMTILGSKTVVPTLGTLRMQRWTLMLQAYNYKIKYRKSEDHGNDDTLSRSPPHGESITAWNLLSVVCSPVHASDIAEKTRRDPILEYALNGWPNHVDKDLQMYLTKRDDLSTEQGCLLWVSRGVIPSIYHQVILEELHAEHSGISQTKPFARSYIWWPGMDAAIERMLHKCVVCQSVNNQPAVAPLHPWP